MSGRFESRVRLDVLRWLAHGEVGMSSKAMALACLGIIGDIDHPYDPDDFHRCVKLLKAVPALRKRMRRVRKLSGVWRNLVDHWATLESMLEREIAGDPHFRYATSETDALMKKLGCR